MSREPTHDLIVIARQKASALAAHGADLASLIAAVLPALATVFAPIRRCAANGERLPRKWEHYLVRGLYLVGDAEPRDLPTAEQEYRVGDLTGEGVWLLEHGSLIELAF